jgi:2-succinyl-5-enolpyruvyl-6-hydroxy-3-cyclohexene-1-carboxylate synthase
MCATFVDEWARAGITDAVVCPGSRSTPMALALAADPRIRVHIHHDERSGAFLALGLALGSGQPAVVLTTSGTAAVELHPAVVEAHHSAVPLLVLTADRPPELHGVGAPQTIDQQGLFTTSTRAFIDVGVPERSTSPSWRRLAARAAATARGDRAGPPGPGPVHLNVAFREPLIGRSGPLPGVDEAIPPTPVATTDLLDRDRVHAAVVRDMAERCAPRRGVIVAGAGCVSPEAVHHLAEVLGWPVLAEPRSGARIPAPATVAHFDSILRDASLAESLAPEVVLRLGELPASKVLLGWLAGLDAWQVGVDAAGRLFDPDGVLDQHLAIDPAWLCNELADVLGAGVVVADPLTPLGPDAPDGPHAVVSWRDRWVDADRKVAVHLDEVLRVHVEPTEPAVARAVLAAMPDGSTLVASSSMPVRDLEWFGANRTGVRVVANRGANGIDGVTSTALGVALGSGAPTALLIGDVAFLHDVNGLLGAGGRGADLCIVVVDNDGGGIFSFLPPATALDVDTFERLFGTPHGVELLAVAGAYGVPAERVSHAGDVGPAVQAALVAGGVRVVTIRTNRHTNPTLHATLHAAFAD